MDVFFKKEEEEEENNGKKWQSRLKKDVRNKKPNGMIISFFP